MTPIKNLVLAMTAGLLLLAFCSPLTEIFSHKDDSGLCSERQACLCCRFVSCSWTLQKWVRQGTTGRKGKEAWWLFGLSPSHRKLFPYKLLLCRVWLILAREDTWNSVSWNSVLQVLRLAQTHPSVQGTQTPFYVHSTVLLIRFISHSETASKDRLCELLARHNREDTRKQLMQAQATKNHSCWSCPWA